MTIAGNSFAHLAAEQVTISSGVATITKGDVEIAPESGDSDDLDTLTVSMEDGASTDKAFFVLYAASGKTIVLKHNTGNILTADGNDLPLAGQYPIWCHYDGANVRPFRAGTVLDEGPSAREWAFATPSGAYGTYYVGGDYEVASSDNDFSGSPTFGSANKARAARFFVVLGAVTVDELTIRVTGTSITDGGVRTASDTEDIVIPSTTPVDTYFETAKKWNGTVTISVQAGTAKTCNYGFCKYWNEYGRDFEVRAFECGWLAGAADSGFDLKLRHHKDTGWTFNSAAAPTPPTPLRVLSTDYSTEKNLAAGERGHWRRTGLSHAIAGSDGEGVLWEIVSGANDAVRIGNLSLEIVPT